MLRYDVPLRSLATSVCVDFEHGLINACKEFFGLDTVIGCFFHWLQAVLRHFLLKIKFQKDRAYEILDLCRFLTCIPPDEVWPKGIPFLIESQLITTLRTTNANQVLLLVNYMRHTWCVLLSFFYLLFFPRISLIMEQDRTSHEKMPFTSRQRTMRHMKMIFCNHIGQRWRPFWHRKCFDDCKTLRSRSQISPQPKKIWTSRYFFSKSSCLN